VMGPATRTVALPVTLHPLPVTLHLCLQRLHSYAASATEQSRRVGERRRSPGCTLENDPQQDKPEHSGKGEGPV
jgi:hypothetical protein